MRFGEKMRTDREARGIAQEGLARLAGISTSTVQKIESGRVRAPRFDVAMRIATALGWGPDDLLDLGPTRVYINGRALARAS